MSTCTCCPEHTDKIAAVARQAAADVAEVRTELSRNGASSTKEAARNAARSAEEAAARTETLLRRYMASGLDVMRSVRQSPLDPYKRSDQGLQDSAHDDVSEVDRPVSDGVSHSFEAGLDESERDGAALSQVDHPLRRELDAHVSPSLGELNIPTVGARPPARPGIGTAGGLPPV